MNKFQLNLLIKECLSELLLKEIVGDPDKEEMMNYLKTTAYGNEPGFNDAAEIAMYWFAHDYYNGQWSNLYSVLSNSTYTPGRLMRSVADTHDFLAQELYTELEVEYVTAPELGADDEPEDDEPEVAGDSTRYTYTPPTQNPHEIPQGVSQDVDAIINNPEAPLQVKIAVNRILNIIGLESAKSKIKVVPGQYHGHWFITKPDQPEPKWDLHYDDNREKWSIYHHKGDRLQGIRDQDVLFKIIEKWIK